VRSGHDSRDDPHISATGYWSILSSSSWLGHSWSSCSAPQVAPAEHARDVRHVQHCRLNHRDLGGRLRVPRSGPRPSRAAGALRGNHRTSLSAAAQSQLVRHTSGGWPKTRPPARADLLLTSQPQFPGTCSSFRPTRAVDLTGALNPRLSHLVRRSPPVPTSSSEMLRVNSANLRSPATRNRSAASAR